MNEIGEYRTVEGAFWSERKRIIHITLDDKEVYVTESERDAALFRAELMMRKALFESRSIVEPI